jgi:hypothetical protein
MTPYDQELLFTALAFVTVVSDSGSLEKDGTKKVMGLAKLIGEFCAQNVPTFYAGTTTDFPGQSGQVEIDTAIEQYIKDLRDKRNPLRMSSTSWH